MKAIIAALALTASLALPASASAMDLDVTYRATTSGAEDVSWTFRDVKTGDLPQITVEGPSGSPVRIALHVSQVTSDGVVAQARFFEMKRNIYGKESAELLLTQELKASGEKAAGAKVMLEGSGGGTGFTIKLAADG